jgi:hypothetical protein
VVSALCRFMMGEELCLQSIVRSGVGHFSLFW